MDEKEKPFTVSDRRHFSPDGQAREQDASPPPEMAGGEAAAAAPESAAGPRAAPARPVSFGEFVVSLGAQAGVLLAGGTEEAKDETSALEGARQIISILEMLEEKTRGRRSPEEDRILEDLLFQLRMGYVQRAGRR